MRPQEGDAGRNGTLGGEAQLTWTAEDSVCQHCWQGCRDFGAGSDLAVAQVMSKVASPHTRSGNPLKKGRAQQRSVHPWAVGMSACASTPAGSKNSLSCFCRLEGWLGYLATKVGDTAPCDCAILLGRTTPKHWQGDRGEWPRCQLVPMPASKGSCGSCMVPHMPCLERGRCRRLGSWQTHWAAGNRLLPPTLGMVPRVFGGPGFPRHNHP